MSGDLAMGHDGGTVLPSAWKECDDGSWWATDKHEIARLVAVFNPFTELHASVEAALGAIGDPGDMTPLSVVDTEMEEYS